mmetsp:Transcript_5758/g.9538  ORF Transcript_5758/g.9538 Transcript_5758/m.9538 type:complete len:242 (+) Transcript_5758:31-756(+)
MRPLLLLLLFAGGNYTAASSTDAEILAPTETMHPMSTSSIAKRPATEDSSKASNPVNLRTQATIEGDETQIVTIRLKPGQTIRACRSNMMLYMTRGIRMTTAMIKGASRRFLAGDPLFLIDYTNIDPTKEETVALGSKLPSKILALNLDKHGGTLNIRKKSLLVCNVDLETTIRSPKGLLAKIFGAQGFFSSKCSWARRCAIARRWRDHCQTAQARGGFTHCAQESACLYVGSAIRCGILY